MSLGLSIALFLGAAIVVVRAGTSLAAAGDQIAESTGLGRLFVGTLLLAFATSLPEIVTDVTAPQQGPPTWQSQIYSGHRWPTWRFSPSSTSATGAGSRPAARDTWAPGQHVPSGREDREDHLAYLEDELKRVREELEEAKATRRCVLPNRRALYGYRNEQSSRNRSRLDRGPVSVST